MLALAVREHPARVQALRRVLALAHRVRAARRVLVALAEQLRPERLLAPNALPHVDVVDVRSIRRLKKVR